MEKLKEELEQLKREYTKLSKQVIHLEILMYCVFITIMIILIAF